MENYLRGSLIGVESKALSDTMKRWQQTLRSAAFSCTTMQEGFKRINGVLDQMGDFRSKEQRFLDEMRQIDHDDMVEDVDNLIPWLEGGKPFYFRLGYRAEVFDGMFGGAGRLAVTDGESVHEFWDFPLLVNAQIALADWEAREYFGEPEGWIRACTRAKNGEWIMYRRRPDCTKESEHISG